LQIPYEHFSSLTSIRAYDILVRTSPICGVEKFNIIQEAGAKFCLQNNMTFIYSPYIFPLIITALISGWVMTYAWKRRSSPNAAALSIMAFLVAFWQITYALEIAGADLHTKLFWGKLQYIPIATVSLVWLFFAYYQTFEEKHLSRRIILLSSIIPVITIVLALTTEQHGLLWKTVEIKTVGTFSALDPVYGWWFWVHVVYSYIMLVAGSILVLRSIWQKEAKKAYRRQATFLIIALLAPWMGNALYIFDLSPIPQLDLTPFSFAISVAAIAIAIFSSALVRLSPIARTLVVDQMREGMIVIDQRGQIADINPAAAHIIGVPVSGALGHLLEEVLIPWPDLAQRLKNIAEGTDIISVGRGETLRQYEITVSQLYDRQNYSLGHLFLIREVVARASFTPEAVEEMPDKPTHETPELQPEETIEPDSSSRFAWVWKVFRIPVNVDLSIPKDSNPAWFHARERSFTLILRIAAIIGSVALISAPTLNTFDASLPFVISVGLLWVLGSARNIPFITRTVLYLLILYSLAFVETYNFGYSAESFTFFLALAVSGALLARRSGGMLMLIMSLITLGGFGILIGQGIFFPPNSLHGVPVPETASQAITSLLVFAAGAIALMSSITILMGSLNRAWELQTQSLNLLQQERNLLEQRVEERTTELAQKHVEMVKSRNEMRKYFLAIEQSGNSIIITDMQGDIEYTNPKFEELTGYSHEEVNGENLRLLQSGKHSPEFYRDMWKTITSREIWRGEIRNRHKDGSLFWELATIAPVLNQSDEITNYIAIKEDITAKKELEETLLEQNEQLKQEISERLWAEANLEKSELRFRQIVENASDIIYRTDARGYLTYVNDTATRVLACDELGLLGKHFSEFASPSIQHRTKRFYQRQFLASVPNTYYELPIMTEDGREVWIGQNVQVIKEDDNTIVGFQAVARDITEIKQALQALAIARDQALDASQIKSQLLSRVSHELRTPLGGILGYAELLSANAYGEMEESQKKAVSQITKSTMYLAALIDDLLDEAQLNSNTFSLDMQYFEPHSLMEQVRNRMIPLVKSKGLALHMDIPDNFHEYLYGDTIRLQQIIINLLGNAIKFTKQGEVSILFQYIDAEYWRIQVSDTGSGIPEEAQEYIFESFRQVNNAITRQNRGTGLGLSIVKQLVDIMDGSIELKSQVGEGSTFTITLPIFQPEKKA